MRPRFVPQTATAAFRTASEVRETLHAPGLATLRAGNNRLRRGIVWQLALK